MLTRELLKYNRRAGTIKPRFVAENDPRTLELAGQLLGIFTGAAAEGLRRGELEELIAPLIRAEPPSSPAAGLAKLLYDHAEFSPVGELDYRERRKELFLRTGSALSRCGGQREEYARIVGQPGFDLYGDLPENERLREFRPWSAVDLIRRYNLALVQGLLFFADELLLTVPRTDPAELRRLFRYLKFFRLLAEIDRLAGGGFEFRISGPFALFANTRKYALQLAAFFPAVVLLPRWQFRAWVKPGRERLELRLDQQAPLHSHYRNFSRYVPEEIALFHRLFKERVSDWAITGETACLELPGGKVAFPDLSFVPVSGGPAIHLELFHRWHGAQLRPRLEWLTQHPETRLLLGLDRSLVDDAAFEQLGSEFPALRTRMFRFRDFPGVDRVVKYLNGFSSSNPGGKHAES